MFGLRCWGGNVLEDVREEFERRSEEIDVLFSHILKIADKDSGSIVSSDEGLLPILASSLCLMLYNQIESTAFSCVEAIYDDIHERKISFNKLVESFKKKILDDCKDPCHSGKSLLKSIQGGDIAEVLAKASLKLDRVFSGNVDARKIREILALYNLSVTSPSEENSGEDLVTLKDARNALAHGASSFEKYGRNLDISDLERLRNNVREYMSHIIKITGAYLEAELYLAQASVA